MPDLRDVEAARGIVQPRSNRLGLSVEDEADLTDAIAAALKAARLEEREAADTFLRSVAIRFGDEPLNYTFGNAIADALRDHRSAPTAPETETGNG